MCYGACTSKAKVFSPLAFSGGEVGPQTNTSVRQWPPTVSRPQINAPGPPVCPNPGRGCGLGCGVSPGSDSNEARKANSTHLFPPPPQAGAEGLWIGSHPLTSTIRQGWHTIFQKKPTHKRICKRCLHNTVHESQSGGPLGRKALVSGRGHPRGQGSVSQQLQAREPADQQGGLRGRGLGPRRGGLLFGPFLLERDGGAAVEIRAEVAPAAPDVVRTSDQLPLRVGPGEPVGGRGAFFDDRRDPFVTEISAEGILTCCQTKTTSPLR